MTLREKKDRFRHNRKRNTGLIYEFLVRQMANQMIDKDKTGWKKTFSIFEKYFASGMPLAKELELFETLRNSNNLKELAARKILNEVLNHSKKIDVKLLDIKKSNLIKDINYTFGKDFFSKHRVPEYRLLASVQMILDNNREPGKLSENVQRLQIEESLISYMTRNTNEDCSTDNEDKIDSLVYDVAQKKFIDRYGQVLSESQKSLLDRFGKALITKQPRLIKEQILNEKARILTVLRSARTLKEIKEDDIMKQKLEEAIAKLTSVDENNYEASVEEILLYEHLSEELKKND